MGWTARQAATRYFRRHGATVDRANRLVILHFPLLPRGKRGEVAREKHARALEGAGYGIARSIFFEQ
ncbi:MAG: hypothetical protein LBP56_07535 [Odoribacteraceae bacterium]|jgi:hypothetical protein|nr:hypothetical protein [Odoribacteraceae bacterium]